MIGVGGVHGVRDVVDFLDAGASLVQVYTGFVYGGPSFVRDLLCELKGFLKEKGLESFEKAGTSSPASAIR